MGINIEKALGVLSMITPLRWLYDKITPDAPTPDVDRTPTAVTQRGEFIRLLIGRREVGPVMAWAGKRGYGTHEEGNWYWEWGVHVLCVGPGQRLRRIRTGKSSQFVGDITPDNAPSGTLLDTRWPENKARIYWGDDLQQVDADLAAKIGVASRWPRLCFVLWKPKQLGWAARWPDLTYEITAGAEALCPMSGYWITDEDGIELGVNPAHAIYQLLCAPWPWGCGLPGAAVDLGSLEECADLWGAEGESLPVNLCMEGGETAASAIARVLDEVGAVLVQNGGRLMLRPIRPTTAVAIPAAILSTPTPERTRTARSVRPSRQVFSYADLAFNYRVRELVYDDDTRARATAARDTSSTQLTTITSQAAASACVARMALVAMAGDQVQATLQRCGRRLLPGDVITMPDGQRLRVQSVTPSMEAAEAKVQGVEDVFNLVPNYLDLVSDPADDEEEIPADVMQAVIQAPGIKAIWVIRVRGSDMVDRAEVYVSDSADGPWDLAGTDAHPAKRQDMAAAGGTLNRPMDAAEGTGSPLVLDYGPTFTAENTDVDNALDLSAMTARWQAGDQLCVIGSEVCYLQKIEQVAGGWRLRNLIRVQLGTSAADHAVNTPLALIARKSLRPLYHSLITTGATVYVKVRPMVGTIGVDLDSCTAMSLTIA